MKVEYVGMGVISFIGRCIGMIHPYGFVVKNDFYCILLTIYSVIFFVVIVSYLTGERFVVFVATFMMIAFIVGNYAVFYRHFLPIVIFLMWNQNKHILIQYNKFQL